jgi:hypothetical protein
MVRVSIGAIATEREHVARLWDLMRAAVADTVSGSNPNYSPNATATPRTSGE